MVEQNNYTCTQIIVRKMNRQTLYCDIKGVGYENTSRVPRYTPGVCRSQHFFVYLLLKDCTPLLLYKYPFLTSSFQYIKS